jgi:hypothetical protein
VEVVEQMHRFYRDDRRVVWRENRVAKRITYVDGRDPQLKPIAHNLGRVCYEVDEALIESRENDPSAFQIADAR